MTCIVSQAVGLVILSSRSCGSAYVSKQQTVSAQSHSHVSESIAVHADKSPNWLMCDLVSHAFSCHQLQCHMADLQ